MTESVPLSPILTQLKFIDDNINSGQYLKGAFELEDCKPYTTCYEKLVSFFSLEGKVAGDEEFTALAELTRLCRVQHSKGVFSIKGGGMILDALNNIADALNSLKDPALKFKELQEKLQHGKK
jgi:hypothetical protein